MANTKYIPGVCNIDAGGRRKRAIFGIIMIIISVVAWFFLKSVSNQLWQLLIVVPLWLGFNGIWQAVFSFCVGNASRHISEIGGKTEKITNKNHIEQDNAKALRINLYSLASAVILTTILFIIGNLLK